MSYTRQDIITPANAITAVGLLITLIGAVYLNTFGGLLFVIFGRLLDLVDGPVARITRVTPLSIIFDPIADKIALLGILIAITTYDLVPLGVILFITLENVLISYVSVRAQRQNKAVGALIPGKLNMFLQQSAIMLFVIATVLGEQNQTLIANMAYAAFFVSIPFGYEALRAYHSQTKPTRKD